MAGRRRSFAGYARRRGCPWASSATPSSTSKPCANASPKVTVRAFSVLCRAHNSPSSSFLHPAGIDPGHFEAVVMGGEVGCVLNTRPFVCVSTRSNVGQPDYPAALSNPMPRSLSPQRGRPTSSTSTCVALCSSSLFVRHVRFCVQPKSFRVVSVQSSDPKRILFIGNEVDADVYGAKGCVEISYSY